MTHVCPKCNKEFRFKCHLTRHLEKKTPCRVVIVPNNVEDRRLCECGRSFSCEQTYTYRKISCKNIDETQLELMRLREENERLKAQLSEVLKTDVTVDNADDVVHDGTIIWKSENYILVSKELVYEAFEEVEILKFYTMFPNFLVRRREDNIKMIEEFVMYVVKKLHEHPEFRNIRINKNRPDLCDVVSEDRKWKSTSFSEANARIIDDVLLKARKAITEDLDGVKDYNICAVLAYTNLPSCAIEERNNKIKPLMFAHLMESMEGMRSKEAKK